MRKPLSEKEMAKAVEMRLAGKSFGEIAREIRREPGAVSKSLREAGHASMLAAWTAEMDEVVRPVSNDGARCLDIAAKTGNGQTLSAVSNRLTANGIQ